jgi:hypothetical protein
MNDNLNRPFQVGNEIRWEWTGPGQSDGWFKARLVEQAPADYPNGWACEITDQGTLYAPGNWNLPVGARVYVDEPSITLVEEPG